MGDNTRVSKIKISIPAAPGRLLVRDRLLAQLDACVACPLTLVSAPAGYGKTTLVAEWARNAGEGRRIAWVSLDEGDRDGARLLRHLVLALRAHHPELGRDVLELLDGGLRADPNDLLLYLLEDLAAWGEPVVIVFDDYHHGANVCLHAALHFAVRRLPACVRLVAVTRQDPELPLAVWRAKGLLGEIGVAGLQFRCDEVQAFLHDCMGLVVANAEADELYGRTQGWVAALQMAALSLRYASPDDAKQSRAEQVHQFSGRHRYVMDFIATEVMQPLPAQAQAFLRDTCVADDLCVPLCNALTGRADAAEMIASLAQFQVLAPGTDARPGWFRGHRLLLESLRGDLLPHVAAELHGRAARWHEQQNRPLDALGHALAGRDIASCVRLLCRTLGDSFARGEVQPRLAKLDTLPEAVVAANLDLAGCKGWLLCLVGRTAEARPYAELAQRHSSEDGARPPSAVLSVFGAYYELNWGSAACAIVSARAAATHLHADDVALRIMALSFLGQALTLAGRREEAVTPFREALCLGQSAEQHVKGMDAIFHLVPLLQAQGQVREALVLCQQAVRHHCDASGTALDLAAPAHVVLAQSYLETYDLASALAAAQQALSLCRGHGVVYYELHALRLLAKIHWARGEREQAWHALAESRERLLSAHSPRRAAIVETLAAELHLAAGQLQPALRALGHARLAARPDCEELALLKARALLLQNKPQVALDLLDGLEAVARKSGFDGSRMTIHVLQARCWHMIGNRPAERRTLERALVLASVSGARRSLVEDGAPLAASLAELHEVAPDFMATLPLAVPAAGAAGAPATLLDPLTQRDVDVLLLLNRGLRNQEIADQLAITVGTTKQYVNRLFGKMGVRNRVEAVALGRRLQLLR